MRDSKEYKSKEWSDFRELVFQAKGKVCEICKRDATTTVIQCHHEFYDSNRDIWDYDINDITVVCRGCHAIEHEILEPNDGWSLIQIIDNGDCDGKCERQKGNGRPCNKNIRYEHIIVHPKIYEERTVGSECVDHLTEHSKVLAKEYQDALKVIPKINKKVLDLDKPLTSEFFNKKPWKLFITEKGDRELHYRLKRNIENVELRITSTMKKEDNGYSANLSINNKWFSFENQRNNNTYSRIYGDLKDIKKMLLIIQEQQIAKIKEKNIIVDIVNKELRLLLNKMNYKIKK